MGSDCEIVTAHLKTLSLILAANVKSVHNKRIILKDVFVRPNLVEDQLDALAAAVGDSISLQRLCGDSPMLVSSDPDFCTKQVDLQLIPSQDMAKLQRSTPESTLTLSSMGPQYLITLVKMLRDVVSGNVQVANASKVDLNILNMSKPDRMKQSIELVLSLMEYLVNNEDIIVRLTQAGISAETTVAKTRIENERLSGACAAAQGKVMHQEACLKVLMQERAQEKAATSEAERSMQAQLHKTSGELELLKTAHSKCVESLQERNSDVDSLTKTCQLLLTSLGQFQDSAKQNEVLMSLRNDELAKSKAACDRLQMEMTQSEDCYKSLQQIRVQEHDQLTAKVEQLKDDLRAKNASCVKLETTAKELQEQLTTLKEQLSLSSIQSDTLNATIHDLLTRQTADLDAAHTVAAQERELRLGAETSLVNATNKIEDLETRLRIKDQEVSQIRETIARSAAQILRSPISPPSSSRKTTTSSTRKRPFAVMDKAKGSQINLAAHGVPIPSLRAAELAEFPEVPVDLGSPEAIPEIFTRKSLSYILGGSCQGLVVRVTHSATELARDRDICGYLCPNMDHNSWSPVGPGKHGYMQVGLGRDRKLFNNDDEYQHVFVGAGKYFLYCGWYNVRRVDPLTKDEWATLPQKVKSTYSETTFKKEHTKECTDKVLWDSIKSAKQVLDMYNKGELLAPLVRLRCEKFDMDFYKALVIANRQFYANRDRPAPPSKRRRLVEPDMDVDDDDDDNDDDNDDDDDDDVPLSAILANDRGEDPVPYMPGVGESSGTTTSKSSTRVNPSLAGNSASSPALLAIASTSDTTATTSVSAAMTRTPVRTASTVTSTAPVSPGRWHTRSVTRRQSGADAAITLRIPGGRLSNTTTQDKDTDEEMEVEDGLSSDSDDDDLYATD